MASSFDILVVASQEDRVASRLRQDLEETGRQVCQLDGPTAARLFTIRIRQDRATVMPSVPMFIRPSAWRHDQRSDNLDERFLRAETYATFWAAAALSQAPVINRPGSNGPVHRLTWGSIATAVRTPLEEAGNETYVSGPEMLRDTESDGTACGEEVVYRTAPIAEWPRGMPLRTSRAKSNALRKVVTVVGRRAFPATPDVETTEFNLLRRSIRLSEQMKVHFATITWLIDDGVALPVYLNAAPEDGDFGHAWNYVANALCEDLSR